MLLSKKMGLEYSIVCLPTYCLDVGNLILALHTIVVFLGS